MAEYLPSTNESVSEKLKEEVKNKKSTRTQWKAGNIFPTELHNILEPIYQVSCWGTEQPDGGISLSCRRQLLLIVKFIRFVIKEVINRSNKLSNSNWIVSLLKHPPIKYRGLDLGPGVDRKVRFSPIVNRAFFLAALWFLIASSWLNFVLWERRK